MGIDHDGIAVIAGDRTLTYADLRSAERATSDVVEIIGANTPEFVLRLFGAWRNGATAVPLSGRLREYELERIRADLQGPVRKAAAILYTSGSTGDPKGAYLTHHQASHWARVMAELLELTPQDRVGLIIPMSHAFGLATLLSALYAGAAVVLIENERALGTADLTVLNGSPAVFGALPDRGWRGLVGGAPSPPELFERHPRILNIYGMTEIGPAAAGHGATMRPLPGYEIRIVEGEVQVRGAGVTPGYHGGPETGRWFATGDLGELDGDGLRLTGRASDVIHVGGFNVFPAEVENFLLTHPDVTEAAVLGAPHPRMGEVVKAYVVSSASPAELIRFARANIAGYKVPYGIEVREALPRLASGKVDKRALT